MAWVNLLECVYPVGSIYMSTTSTSPAALIGGTWTAITDATIAAQGTNYGGAGNYSGSDSISTSQLPKNIGSFQIRSPNWGKKDDDHNTVFQCQGAFSKEDVDWGTSSHGNLDTSLVTWAYYQVVTLSGGALLTIQDIIRSMRGPELLNEEGDR